MTIGSLCSGYGGLDIGLQSLIGGEVAWHFEYEKAPSKILEHHYPGTPNYGDITKTDWDIQPVDWITAGYPCQPFSLAGNRKGTDDKRHIWPYIWEGIRTLRPGGVLLENVAGHLTLGFDRVLGDLAAIGYDAQWICVRASDAGAPHGRKRLFIVAHPNRDARSEPQRINRSVRRASSEIEYGANREIDGIGIAPIADSDSDGSQARNRESGSTSTSRSRRSWPSFGPYSDAIERWERILGRSAPTPIDENDRLTAEFVEWMMGLPNGHVTGIGLSWSAQLKALGNGVVPQQAALALRLIGVAA